MKDPARGLERFIWWLIVPLIVAVVSGLIIANLQKDPEPTATPEITPNSNEFIYTVKLISEQDQAPISSAKLDLKIENQLIQKETDLNGQATFQIPNIYNGKIGELNIEIDGEYVGFLEMELAKEFSPNEISINLKSNIPEISTPTKAPSATATATIIPEEPTATVTPSQTATQVSSPTPSATPTATPTLTPTPSNEDTGYLIVVAPRGTAVNIYTQASSVTGAPRAQVVQDDILLILESDGDWHRVQIQKNGIEGWIENKPADVQPFNGTPPATSIPATIETTATSSCITVSTAQNSISDDIFDDVTLNWHNPPAGTSELKIEVKGINSNGQNAVVVGPVFSDLNSPYTVQQWMFEAGNFTFDSTYTFFVTVLDGAGNQICQTTGTFSQ
ncbi:MAG: hypothetical protein KC449_10895 [Anaerolineales bacterium]|nr:hypothetical protein [Anaerolineales bacterium]